MRIAMIGTGYVGLVSGACFSEFGVSVTCVDKDADKIARLSRGEIPIFEPGLDQLVASNAAAGRLTLHDRPQGRGRAAPTRCSSRSARRRGAATAMPISAMSSPPPPRSPRRSRGAAGRAHRSSSPNRRCRSAPAGGSSASSARRCRADRFDVASNPEFLREGSAIQDFMRPDRVVIGTDSEHARERAAGALPAALSARNADGLHTASRPPS